MVDLIDLTESDEEDVHPVSPAGSSDSSSSSSGLVIMSVESQEPPKLHVDGDGDIDFNEDSDTPTTSTADAAITVDSIKRNSPPVLSHYMNLDPWNYYLSTSSHSATSSVAASSGCLFNLASLETFLFK